MKKLIFATVLALAVAINCTAFAQQVQIASADTAPVSSVIGAEEANDNQVQVLTTSESVEQQPAPVTVIQVPPSETATPVVIAKPNTVIDFNPLIETLMGILATVLAILGTYGVMWIKKKLGIDSVIKEDQVRSLFDKYLEEGVKYGIQKLENVDWTKVETKNAIIAEASNYVIEQHPKLLAKTGYDAEGLGKRLESKLQDFDQNPTGWKQVEGEVEKNPKDAA